MTTLTNVSTALNYQKQATDFLNSIGAKVVIKYHSYGAHFPGEKENRNIYRVIITRIKNGKSFSFNFGDSIYNTEKDYEPCEYNVLTCLQKNDPGTFEDFCFYFGYDTDSRTAEKTYKSVCREWKGVNRVFGDVLDKLQEIK